MVSKIVQSGLRCAACVLIISLTEAIIYEAWRPCRQGKQWCLQIQHGADQSLMWGAMTSLIVTLADVGSSAEKGWLRSVGTIVGGLLGLACAEIVDASARLRSLLFVLLASVGSFVIKVWGDSTGRAYAGVLGAATFVMIMWNAYYLPAPIWLIAVTRTGGILFGVLVAMLVSNVVFPQSLSASVLEDIATAGEQLAKQSDLLWASILSTKGFDKTARDEHKNAFYEDNFRRRYRTIVDSTVRANKLEFYGRRVGARCRWTRCLPDVASSRRWRQWCHDVTHCSITTQVGWCPKSFGLGPGLDADATRGLVQSMLRINNLLDACFVVVADTLNEERLLLLHKHHRVDASGGASALLHLREDTRRVLGSIAACLRPPFDAVPDGLGALVYGTTTTLLDRLEVQETVEGSASLPRRVVLDDGTPRRFHLRWTTFLVLYGDLAKELRAFADVADAWLETLPNRPRRLQRDESGVEADEDLDDGEGAA